jgi:hypothetical protein
MSCRSGFARFTNCRFSMRREDIANTFIHLTNVAIQKHAPTFDKDKGMKWPIRSLRLFLNTRHGVYGPCKSCHGCYSVLILCSSCSAAVDSHDGAKMHKMMMYSLSGFFLFSGHMWPTSPCVLKLFVPAI